MLTAQEKNALAALLQARAIVHEPVTETTIKNLVRGARTRDPKVELAIKPIILSPPRKIPSLLPREPRKPSPPMGSQRPDPPPLIPLPSEPAPSSGGLMSLIFGERERIRWRDECQIIKQENEKRLAEYKLKHRVQEWQRYDAAMLSFQKEKRSWEEQVLQIKQSDELSYENSHKNWETQKVSAEQQHNKLLNLAAKLELSATQDDPGALDFYVNLSLNASPYPATIIPNFSVSSDIQSRVILIECHVCPFSNFNVCREDVKQHRVAVRTLKKLYDLYIFSVILRSSIEIYLLNPLKRFETIAINIKTQSKNPATGLDVKLNLASIMISTAELRNLDINFIDPEAFFRRARGIAAASLAENVEVAPIITFDKTDHRFIEARKISPHENENLAEISWEDFEHLVRQLFEHHFRGKNADVKITQSTRDQGVDAVIFDPDPILGGKIVVQAKRYTSTVDVKYVRELWATTQNEGANKGILVTTSSFGYESYEWAKEKNLTLINGTQFLALLKQYGYHYKLDLEQARQNRLSGSSIG